MGKLLVLLRYSGISNFDCRLCRIPDLSARYLDWSTSSNIHRNLWRYSLEK